MRFAAFPLTCVLASAVLMTATSTAALAAPESPEPLVVEMYGDSVTTGMWADTSPGHINLRFRANMVLMPLLTKILSSIGQNPESIEDPIERAYAFDRMGAQVKRPRLSAFIGNADYSLPTHLQSATQRPVRIVGEPMLAGHYAAVEAQTRRVEATYAEHPELPRAELIVVNLNGIDFVFNIQPPEFRASVRQFLLGRAATNPQARIVITELLDNVSLVAAPDQSAFVLFGSETLCSQMYKQFNFGVAQGVYPGATGDVVDKAQEYRRALNDVLSDEAAKMNARTDGYEAFAGRTVVIRDLAPSSGTWRDRVAADCVHPNIAGQRDLGDRLWETLQAEGWY